MKRIIFSILVLFSAIVSCTENSLSVQLPEISEPAVNFIIANDLGRNGYYEQKTIAQLMGYVAENRKIEMVAAAGDVHHFEGVAS
ncbi:MAG: acid phosphatase, partial [Candidatus Symbiothrix sp.]|nr:acid phosphatase [Candidatus Symbiothrix sp.]